MKVLTLLLAVLLCLGGAWALKCYSCNSNSPSQNTCSQSEECSASNQACLSQTISIESQGQKETMVAKGCVQSCANPAPGISKNVIREYQIEAYVQCCTTDLCNGAGGPGPGPTTMTLMLVASTLATLLGACL